MKIVDARVEDIVPYDNNPRNNDSAVDYVANSIRQFGFKVPIVVDSDNVIIAGHTRYLAAKQLGLATVPVIVASDLTPEQVKAFRIADNKTSEKSDWNMLKLSKEIIGLDFDFGDFGFGEVEIDNLTSLGNDFFGVKEDSFDQISSPNAYTPNTSPQESKTNVSADQVSSEKERLETSFSSQAVYQHRLVVCPHCCKEFEID